MAKKKIIVVGGGFAGLETINRLDDNLFDILLIDKLNHHQFQPLFYQVATSQIEPSSISFPFRHIFRNRKNIQIRLADFYSVEHAEKTITTSIGRFQYDYLVIALGCKTNFFGNEELSKHVLSLKSTYDAINIRNHILLNFEKILSPSITDKEGLYNIVIVGGGPTGVELAGAFAEIKNNILPKDFHRIDFTNLRVILVDAGKSVLNNMSVKAKNSAIKYLEDLGVELLFEKMVKHYDGETLSFQNGDCIKTKSVIWASGVIGNEVQGIPMDAKTFGNRIKVDRINKVIGLNDVFVVGDLAYMETAKYPKGHPQIANVAINQAKNLAKNLKNIELQKAVKEYEYTDLGNMATIGRNKAVCDLPFGKVNGLFGWIIWMFLHLMLILEVKNKIIIFINWAWAYFTKNTSLRLILSNTKK